MAAALHAFSGIGGLEAKFHQDQDGVVDPWCTGLRFNHGSSDGGVPGEGRGNFLQFPGDGLGGLFANLGQGGRRLMSLPKMAAAMSWVGWANAPGLAPPIPFTPTNAR